MKAVDRAAASQFINDLYGDGATGVVRVMTRAHNGVVTDRYFSVDQKQAIVDYICGFPKSDVYISRATFIKQPNKTAPLSELRLMQRAISVDLDYGAEGHSSLSYPTDKASALQLLAESGVQEPTSIIHTGNGLLVLWLLDEAQPADTALAIQRGIEKRIQLAASRHNWTVDSTSDPARNLRVPGTYNWKRRDNPKPVVVIGGSKKLYTVQELDEFAYTPLPSPRRVNGTVTKEAIRQMLKVVPGDGLEYNRWLAVVWGIQGALSEEEAAEVLNEWTHNWEPHSKPDHAESGIGALVNLAREYGYTGAVGTKGGYVASFQQPDAIHINQRFVDIELHINEEAFPKVMTLKSDKGTGKTEFLARVAQQYDRVLCVSHRISLVRQIAARLGLTPYHENGVWTTNAPRCATTIHSLDKLSPDKPYKVVFIDESEQLFKALVNDKNLSTRKVSALGALVEHITKAKLVIFADADIGEATETFISDVLAEKPIVRIVNDYRHRQLDYLVLLPSPEEVFAQALNTALDYESKVAIACNTRADADRAELFFKQTAPNKRLLKITAESGADNQETLERINDILRDVDIFIYSPSVGTGVSIEVDDFYLYGVARNGVGIGDVDDFRQQLGRFRHPVDREARVWVDPKRMSEKTHPDNYRDLVYLKEIEASFRISRRNGKPEPQTQWDKAYLNLYAVVKAKTAAQKNAFRENIIGAYTAEGVEVWDDRNNKDEHILDNEQRARIAKKLKEQRAEAERQRAERIANAPTVEEAKTKEEKADAERKAELEGLYGIDVDADLVLDDEDGAYKKAQRFAAVENNNIAEYLDETETSGAKKRFRADRSFFLLFAFWFQTLAAALKLRLEEGAEIAITDEFVQLVETNKVAIETALGVKVQSDFQRRPMVFVSALLGKIGVGVEGKQHRAEGKRTRTYCLVNVERARLRATGVRKRYEENAAVRDVPDFAGCHSGSIVNTSRGTVTTKRLTVMPF